MKIYLAASIYNHILMESKIGKELESQGHDIVSTWHINPKFDNQLMPEEINNILLQNHSEILECDWLIACLTSLCKETYFEILYALNSGKKIAVFTIDDKNPTYYLPLTLLNKLSKINIINNDIKDLYDIINKK